MHVASSATKSIASGNGGRAVRAARDGEAANVQDATQSPSQSRCSTDSTRLDSTQRASPVQRRCLPGRYVKCGDSLREGARLAGGGHPRVRNFAMHPPPKTSRCNPISRDRRQTRSPRLAAARDLRVRCPTCPPRPKQQHRRRRVFTTTQSLHTLDSSNHGDSQGHDHHAH